MTLTKRVDALYPHGMCSRALSSQSLLGLIGLEGEDCEDTKSTYVSSSSQKEEKEVYVELSPSTRNTPQGIDDVTITTTPPGSVQGPGVFSLSPPLLTTYSSSTTEVIALRPRQSRRSRHEHSPQESPQLPEPPTTTVHHHQQQQQPRSRPPRAPQLPSSLVCGNNNGQIIFPRAITSIGPGPELGSGAGHGGGHTRIPTDASNCSFLSSLTDTSGGGLVDFNLPRRRTLSWDNSADIGEGGTGAATTGSSSFESNSLPGNILQPILRKDEEKEDYIARPPMSIWASNLRKASPARTPPTLSTPARTPPRGALVQSSLPSRENLHPLLVKRQHYSPPDITLACSSSTYTATTTGMSPFAYGQDEKKDDSSRSSLQPFFERGDLTSYSFSPFTPCIRLKRRTTANFRSSSTIVTHMNNSQRSNISNKINTDLNKVCKTRRLALKEVSTKEFADETEIIKGVETDFCIEKNGVVRADVRVYSLSKNWPYFVLFWGILNLVLSQYESKNSYFELCVNVVNILFCRNFSYFCCGLGATAALKKALFKKLSKERILEHYRDQLSILMKQLVILNEIVFLSTKRNDCLYSDLSNGENVRKTDTKNSIFNSAEEKKVRVLEEEYNSDANTKHTIRFQNAVEYIDRFIDHELSPSFGKFNITREDFVESSQIIFERLVSRTSTCQGEIGFQLISQVAKLSNGSTDVSKITMLLRMFRPSQQGRVSKSDFVSSIDKIYKTMRLLIASIDNFSRTDSAFENIINVIFYTIVAIAVPSIFGVDINTLYIALIAILINFTCIVCFTCAEYLKGILRILTQKPYDIGDRVCFISTDDSELKLNNGPLLGGWIIEKYDLYTTTVRQGITGERTIFVNGSLLLDNTRVVNWKRSQSAKVLFSLKFPGHIRREQIKIFRGKIIGWIEDHPREWDNLDVFRAVNVNELECVEYNIVIRHRESWQNYSTVEQSRSDALVFLLELKQNINE